ncbi:MAG: hypothetical protein Edafosvirus19_14 [Edafosvirus sp.]|uniref:Uncharacterized protein n=1 Tax=Edafosvirus sp. TaxID=2487765 RepID=A0A3G4ZUL3_9VIRU|nr:MAG: hypothetical protein Edafosvirus19_14 [Edafosvirus sp.]
MASIKDKFFKNVNVEYYKLNKQMDDTEKMLKDNDFRMNKLNNKMDDFQKYLDELDKQIKELQILTNRVYSLL